MSFVSVVYRDSIQTPVYFTRTSRCSSATRLDTILEQNAEMHLVDDVPRNPNHGQNGHKGYKRFKLPFVLERFRSIHNDTYAYHHVVYKNANTPVRVICPKHGEFFIKPVQHWRGKGCDECS